MSQTELAATSTPSATPLAGLLAGMSASAGQAQEPADYRGVLTPLQLDAPERETEALAEGAAVHDLGWMRRVAVRGEDSFRWLSGMVTNTVIDLDPGAGAWNLVLNAQGRIQGDLWVWRGGDDLELEIAAGQYDKLLAHLNRFIIMDDVELIPLDPSPEQETALGLSGRQADSILARVGLPTLDQPLTQLRAEWNGIELRLRRSYGVLGLHYELFAPAAALAPLWKALREAGATPAGTASLDAFRIAEAIPAYGIDIAERDLPQETSQTRALSFNKGCYLGQEIVERIRSRGSVHRHLRHLELTGPPPAAGTELFVLSDPHSQSVASAASSKAAGQITSAAELPLSSGHRVFALAMIRAEAEVGGHPFTYAAGSASGTARILAVPPALNPEPIGNREL
jgi:folate-binding protein YgfZ